MKNKLISLTIIMLLSSAIFLATTSIASAQSVVAGVSIGETFDYSYSLIWASTDPSATPSNDLVEYNNTQKIQFKITDVDGPDLSVDFIRLFNNGTQTVESGSINIESGTVSVPYGFLIIGANLNKNQQVYPTGGHQVITDTVTRSFAGVQRETNVISSEDSSEKLTIDFDRAKGVALDYLFEIRETSGNYNIVSTETLTSTNSNDWGVTSSTLSLPLVAIVIVIIAVIIVVVAIAVFRKKRKPSASTLTAE
jgi:hypothetical protein